MLLIKYTKQTYRHMHTQLFTFSFIKYMKNGGSPLPTELQICQTQQTFRGKCYKKNKGRIFWRGIRDPVWVYIERQLQLLQKLLISIPLSLGSLVVNIWEQRLLCFEPEIFSHPVEQQVLLYFHVWSLLSSGNG